MRVRGKKRGMHQTVSHQLADALSLEGVQRVYGAANGCVSSLMDALTHHEQLTWVGLRNEGSAAFAASAEAQLTGRLAVCMSSNGPNCLQMLNGLHDARRSRATVLAVAAHAPSRRRDGQDFQEIAWETMRRASPSCCEEVTAPAQLQTMLQTAIRHARSRQSVGSLVLPVEIADMEAVPTSPGPTETRTSLKPKTETCVLKLAAILNRAERIAFLCGAGCRHARNAVLALAGKLRAPVAYTLRAKEFMEPNNPYAIGMIGLLGWGAAPDIVKNCDLLVMWGSDFPYPDFLPPERQIAQVDIQPRALGRRASLCASACGDAGDVARALNPLMRATRGDDFLEYAKTLHGKAVSRLMKNVRKVNENAPLRPEYVTRLISDYAEPDAIFLVDAGPSNLWAARYLQAMPQRRILGSFSHGATACAVGMSIGAKSVYPHRQVIALTDSESLLQQIADLRTLAEAGQNVKIFVYDNAKPEQNAAEPECRRLKDMNWLDIARGLGIDAHSVTLPESAITDINRWLQQQLPSLLIGRLDAHALASPPPGTEKDMPSTSRLDAVKQLLFGNAKLFRKTARQP